MALSVVAEPRQLVVARGPAGAGGASCRPSVIASTSLISSSIGSSARPAMTVRDADGDDEDERQRRRASCRRSTSRRQLGDVRRHAGDDARDVRQQRRVAARDERADVPPNSESAHRHERSAAVGRAARPPRAIASRSSAGSCTDADRGVELPPSLIVDDEVARAARSSNRSTTAGGVDARCRVPGRVDRLADPRSSASPALARHAESARVARRTATVVTAVLDCRSRPRATYSATAKTIRPPTSATAVRDGEPRAQRRHAVTPSGRSRRRAPS